MKTINKDITEITEGIICHQVNCQKKMGSGLAKTIREKWEEVYHIYMHHDWKLGEYQVIGVTPDLCVANLAGQDRYGYDGKQYTDYDGLRQSLSGVYEFAKSMELTLYVPHGIGCGLGGGDWTEVSKIIEEVAPDAVICKYESN